MKRWRQNFFTVLQGSVFALFFLVAGCSKDKACSTDDGIIEISFDVSMGKDVKSLQPVCATTEDEARYLKSQELYQRHLPSKIESSSEPRIPKIIHQIWLGPKLPPSSFFHFQDHVRRLHPDWEYHLWSESDLEALELDNWDIVQKSDNYAEMSDIIRADLLDRFGGVYFDADVDLLQKLDELHEKYDFYAGMEHPHKIATTDNRIWVGISIMASRPGHPIMQNWKRRVRDGWDEVNLRYSNPVERVINHTYFQFTHAVMQEIDRPGNVDMLFPATYFYPIAPNFASKRRSTFRKWRERFYDFLESVHLRKARAFSRIQPETIAVHYWTNLWLPTTEYQVKSLEKVLDSERRERYKLLQRVQHLEKQLLSWSEQLEELRAETQLAISSVSSSMPLSESDTVEDVA